MSDVPEGDGAGGRSDTDRPAEVDLTIVTLRFDAADDAALLAVLSKYVVLTRMHDGCRTSTSAPA